MRYMIFILIILCSGRNWINEGNGVISIYYKRCLVGYLKLQEFPTVMYAWSW